MDATVVCIDQIRKPVQVESRVAWFPRGTRPSVEFSGQRDWTFATRFSDLLTELTTAIDAALTQLSIPTVGNQFYCLI